MFDASVVMSNYGKLSSEFHVGSYRSGLDEMPGYMFSLFPARTVIKICLNCLPGPYIYVILKLKSPEHGSLYIMFREVVHIQHCKRSVKLTLRV